MAYRGSGLTPFTGAAFPPVFGLRREIDRLFDDLIGGSNASGRNSWSPAVDVREDQNALDIDLELPGMRPEDVEINVENGVLTVSGEKRSQQKEGDEGRYHVIERSRGSFFRAFQLPKGVDEGQITANFDNGVLTLRIPKAALPQPRRIEIGQEQSAGSSAPQHVGARSATSGRGQSGRTEERGGSASTSHEAGRMAANEGGSSENRK